MKGKTPADKAKNAGDIGKVDEGAVSKRLWNLNKRSPDTTFAELGSENESGARIRLEGGAIVGGVYTIVGQIGQGGMGEVYLAQHNTLEKPCALKLIPPEQVTKTSWARFQQEAKAIATLEHVNIVKVTDLGIHKGYLPFYAMEYVDGDSLSETLCEIGRFTLADTLEIFSQVCDGVEHAHRAGIIHRDLKPANIMVVGQRGAKKIVKILDFGLAKLTGHDRDKQSLTAVGEVFGSPYYMSPEQCAGEKIDERSDIYSVGCTLFECLVGRPPFDGNIATAIIFSHQNAEPAKLNAAVGAEMYPQAMENVMAKLLRKNPLERYQSFDALKNDLQRVGKGLDVEPFVRVKRGALVAPAQNSVAGRSPSSYSSSSSSSSGSSATSQSIFSPRAAKNSFIALVVSGIALTTVAAAFMVYLLTDKKAKPILKPLPLVGYHYPTVSGGDRSLDSQIIRQNGLTFLVFNLPENISMGRLQYAQKSVQAEGIVKIILPNNLTFEIGNNIVKTPELFRRFAAGDLYGISFSATDNINAAMNALQFLPEFRSLHAVNLTDLNDPQALSPKNFDILNSINRLDSLYCQSSALSSEQLIKLACLKHLKTFAMSEYTEGDKIVHALKASLTIKTVMIDRSTISKAGFVDLASLPALADLYLKNVGLNKEKLAILTSAKKLQRLMISGRLTCDDGIVQTLSRFGPEVTIYFEGLSEFDRSFLKTKKLPNVRVGLPLIR